MSGIPPKRDRGAGEDRRDWAGFAEIDEAIRENRLTEYRVKKAWKDPWARTLGIVVLSLFACFIAFVVYWDLIKS